MASRSTGTRAATSSPSVDIHDNEISNVDRDGILLGWTDADVLTISNVRIYNNVIHRAGTCSGWGLRVTNGTATGIDVFHNTIVDSGGGTNACDESGGEVMGLIGIEDGSDLSFENNLLAAAGGEGMIENFGGASLSGSHNLWSGGGAAAWDAGPIAGDPAFVESGLRLQARRRAAPRSIRARISRRPPTTWASRALRARPRTSALSNGPLEAAPGGK